MPAEIADVAEAIFYVEDSSAPLTVVKPAAFGPGQLLLFVIGQDATLALADLTGPAGWTDEGNYDQASNQGRVWSHFYDAADPSTWNFGYNAGADIAGVLLRITGADPAVIVDLTSDNTGPIVGSATSPTITPPGISDLYIATLSLAGGGTALTETDPTGLNNLGQGQVAGNFQAIAAAYKQLSDGSAVGAQTWTSITPGTVPGGTFSITVKSSGYLDPDPPLRPPAAEIPPWLFDELMIAKARRYVANIGAPLVKEKLVGSASAGTVTLTTAATTDTTDLLVARLGNNFYTAAGLVAPTGTAGTWTLWATGDNGTNSAHAKVWTRPVTAAGAQVVIGAPAIDEEIVLEVFVVSGADLTNPVDGAAGANGASATAQIAPSITTATTSTLLLASVTSTVDTTYTSPAGMYEQSDKSFAALGPTSSTASIQLDQAQSSGTKTFTAAIAGAWAATTIAITPHGTSVIIKAETGNLSAGAASQATAVKVAPVAAVVSAGAAGHATRATVIAETGTVPAGTASSATAVKVAPQTGNCSAGTATGGASAKHVGQTGVGAAGAVSSGGGAKRVAQIGTAAGGAATPATARHAAPRTGTSCAGVTASGAAAKHAPASGPASAGAVSTHSGVSTRAVAGTLTAGAALTGVATHTAPRSAYICAGAVVRAGAAKAAAPNGVCASGGKLSATVVHIAPRAAAILGGAAAAATVTKTARPSGPSLAGAATLGPTAIPPIGDGRPIVTISRGLVATSSTDQGRIQSQTVGGRS